VHVFVPKLIVIKSLGKMKKKNYLPVLLSGTSLITLTVAAQQQKPNIVVIVADDLGTTELGCYGGTNLLTPISTALLKKESA
jgi:hypothetical protein